MFLGIDLGTSSVKVVLIDEEQNLIASTSSLLTVSRPHPHWSEQDPLDWWQATQSAVQELRSQNREALSQTEAIGLSGQMHGATLLDSRNALLRPAILWNDGRSHQQCQTIQEREPNATKITGNLIMPGFTAPKLVWVKENEPAIFDRIDKILLPKDYLRFCMTGEYATDMSDASGTSWLNVGERQWSDEMLAATEVSRKQMPALFEGPEITGTVLPQIAKSWGISEKAVVVAGGGDNAASAISMNVIEPGSAFLSLGTSGVYFVSNNRFLPNPEKAVHAYCHCLPNLWHEMSVHLSCASCLNWAAKLFNLDGVLSLLEQTAHYPHRHTPLFLPYLSGERTPHNNPHARGVFFGLSQDSGPESLTQAILEGVAFAFALGQQAMVEAGVGIDEVTVIGGGSQSLYWGKILASVLQRPLIYREQAEAGGALGAARLAWLSQHTVEPQKAFKKPAIRRIVEPDEQKVAEFEEKLKQFIQLYDRVSPLFCGRISGKA